MSRETNQLDDATLELVRAFGTPEPAWLQSVRADAESRSDGEMQISAEQGQLFRWLVAVTGARRVLEAGTFTGYSSLVFAESVGPDGTVVTVDANVEIQAEAERNARWAGLEERIEYVAGDGVERFRAMLPERRDWFDLAFLDADKQRIVEYAALCLELVRPGGMVLVDNYFRGGKAVDPAAQDDDGVGAMHALTAFAQEQDLVRCAIPISDGIAAMMVGGS